MVRPAPLTVGYRSTPYWWDDVTPPSGAPGDLPVTADVAVVGAGYTGLAAAWELARRGRRVVVLERGDVGAGASGRNGGMAHPGGKPSSSEFLALPDGPRLWRDAVVGFEEVEECAGITGADLRGRASEENQMLGALAGSGEGAPALQFRFGAGHHG